MNYTKGTAHPETREINLAGAKTLVAAVTIDGKIIAMTATAASPRYEQAQIDAKRIALCLNHHDALAQACIDQYAVIDQLMQGIKALAPDFDPTTHPAWEATQYAQQVIEAVKAEG
jgi:hypothetical protein